MKRLVKILAAVLAIVIVLVVVAVVVLPFVFDPNAHKAEITQLIEQRIGRDVSIPGDIELSVFPWLGVSVGQVTVANAPGFGDRPLAAIDAAEVRVKLLPLLHRQVEVGTVVLNGLSLRLARNAAGRTNWAGIAEQLGADAGATAPDAGADEQDETAPNGGFGLESLHIDSIAVRKAAVTWNDAVTGSSYRLSDFYLTTGALTGQQPFRLKTGATLAAATRGLIGHVAVTSTVQPDVSAGLYRFDDIEIKLDASGDAVPGGEQNATLTGQGELNLAAGTLQLEQLEIRAAGLDVSGQVSAKGLRQAPQFNSRFEVAAFSPTQLMARLGMGDNLPAGDGTVAFSGQASVNTASGQFALDQLQLHATGLEATATVSGHGLGQAPAFSGQLSVPAFDPRQVLASFGLALPQLQGDEQGDNVLHEAALDLDFAGTPDSIKIDQLRLALDDTVLTGNASVAGFATPDIRFDADADAFNLDAYLPAATTSEPAQQNSSSSSGDAGSAAPAHINLAFLRDLTLDGKLHVGQLTAYGMHFDDAALAIAARDGVLTVKPLTSGFYDGSIHAVATLDASGQVPQYALQAKLAQLKFAPLLKDLVGTDKVSALADLHLDLSSSGDTVDAIKQALDGNVSFALSDGTFHGFDLAQLLAAAKSRLLKDEAPAASGTQATPFSQLAGSFAINNGIVSGDDLKLVTQYLEAAGGGQYNLLANELDYDLQLHVADADADAGPLAEVAGLTVPMHLGGSLWSPQYSIDVKALLKALARQQLQDEQGELKAKTQQKKQALEQKLTDKLSEKLGDEAGHKLGDKLDKKLQKGLSDLFN